MELKEIIEKIMSGFYLSEEEVIYLVKNIKSAKFKDPQFIALLVALQTRNEIKGTSVEESSYFINAFKEDFNNSLTELFCNSGTGGDKFKTINISTPASIIIASAGIRVFKNGSKGTTGGRGAKGALECLGIDTLKELEEVVNEVKKVGIGYYDFSKIVPIKGRPGTKTPLNLLGPLCNPAKLKYKLIGCVDKEYLKSIEPILERTCENYMITYNPTIDEISLCEPTLIIEKINGKRNESWFNPKQEGFKEVQYEEIKKIEKDKENKKLLLEILQGKESPAREIVCLNAGAGLYLASKVNSIKEGYELAKNLIDDGSAIQKLNEWKQAQNE